MTIKKDVDDAIAKNEILVYSKSYCPHSKRAKTLLASIPNKISEPKVYELDLLGQEGVEIQAYLAELTNQRTVPNIFIHQKHVGGADDLFHLNEAGALKTMVTPASQSSSRLFNQPRRLKSLQEGMNSNLVIFLLVLVLLGIGFSLKKGFSQTHRIPEKQKQ